MIERIYSLLMTAQLVTQFGESFRYPIRLECFDLKEDRKRPRNAHIKLSFRVLNQKICFPFCDSNIWSFQYRILESQNGKQILLAHNISCSLYEHSSGAFCLPLNKSINFSCFSCASEEYQPLYESSPTLQSIGQPVRFDKICDTNEDVKTFAPSVRCDAACITVLEPQFFGGILNEQQPYKVNIKVTCFTLINIFSLSEAVQPISLL
jgi:hypothetical protein